MKRAGKAKGRPHSELFVKELKKAPATDPPIQANWEMIWSPKRYRGLFSIREGFEMATA
jgi:hypothetical protein